MTQLRNQYGALAFIFLLFWNFTATAAIPTPAPPDVAASGYLLIDFNSGKTLAERNADQRLEPASLTKIMTAYVVFRELTDGNISLQDRVLVSKKAWRTPGSRMFIEVGKRVSVEDLLQGMIIQSGNDAAVALAEHVAGSEETFANLMNEHARRLGMTRTNFVNSTGLPDPEHYTSPRDIAKVAAAVIREFPQYYRWYSTKEFTFNKITQTNRNLLLWRDKSVDGVKTGHTDSAGYCLVASAERDGMRLISVVMGTSSAEDRARESQALLNYGFRFFQTHRLYQAGQALSRARTWKGQSELVPAGLLQDLFVTIPRGQYKQLKATLNLQPQLMAPIAKGDVLGSVKLTLESDTVAEVPLVALESNPEGGLVRRIKDRVLLWLK